MRNFLLLPLLIPTLWVLLSASFLFGCNNKRQHVGIVHDYVINNAIKACDNNGGLHHIVQKMDIYADKSNSLVDFNDYPCSEVFYFTCQDQTVFKFKDGIAFCFIPESQIQETIKEI